MDRLTRTLLAANARYVRALRAIQLGEVEQRAFLLAEGASNPFPHPGSLGEAIAVAEAVCKQALTVSVSVPDAPADDLHLMQYMLSRFGGHTQGCNVRVFHGNSALALGKGACDCGWDLTAMALPRVHTELEMLPPEFIQEEEDAKNKPGN